MGWNWSNPLKRFLENISKSKRRIWIWKSKLPTTEMSSKLIKSKVAVWDNLDFENLNWMAEWCWCNVAGELNYSIVAKASRNTAGHRQSNRATNFKKKVANSLLFRTDEEVSKNLWRHFINILTVVTTTWSSLRVIASMRESTGLTCNEWLFYETG